MTTSRVAGIDLGSAYCAAAWLEASGRSAMLVNRDGDLLTPSVVVLDDDRLLTGKEADKLSVARSERAVRTIKADLSQPASRKIADLTFPAECLAAGLLRQVQGDLQAALGPDVKVVLAVPSLFNESARNAVLNAGEMASLDVLDVVNESTAAALAIREHDRYLRAASSPVEGPLLIYDLGDTKFEAALVELLPRQVRVLATDGDLALGGADWDARLVDYVAEVFQREQGTDPRGDPVALGRLHRACEEAKRTLSVRNQVSIAVEHAGRSAGVRVSRGTFEALTADLLHKTIRRVESLLEAVGLPWNRLSRVVLIGGASRMPMVAKALSIASGHPPQTPLNPDEAVARGAALYARHLLDVRGGTGDGSLHVTSVSAHSLGIEGFDRRLNQRRNVILIPRHTPLPAVVTENFVTRKAGQRSVTIRVLEGESYDPAECVPIGRVVMRDLPENLMQGWPIVVNYEYGSNALLRVTASVHGTEREVVLDLQRDRGLPRPLLDAWKRALAKGVGLQGLRLLAEQTTAAPKPRASADDELDFAATANLGRTPGSRYEPDYQLGQVPPAQRGAQPSGMSETKSMSDLSGIGRSGDSFDVLAELAETQGGAASLASDAPTFANPPPAAASNTGCKDSPGDFTLTPKRRPPAPSRTAARGKWLLWTLLIVLLLALAFYLLVSWLDS